MRRLFAKVKYIIISRNGRKLFLTFLLLFSMGYIVLILGFHGNFSVPKEVGKKGDPRNYFKNASRLRSLPLLIQTTNCKIPDISIHDPEVLPFLKDLKDSDRCRKRHFNWSSVQGDKLVINRKQVEKDGYLFYPGFCCYKAINRVTVKNIEDENAAKYIDYKIRYSSCISINDESLLLPAEFIMVECGYIKLFHFSPAYRAFHASALYKLTSTKEDANKIRKINHWSKFSKSNQEDETERERLPPNILILGLDSTSRLNFRRKMPQTLKVLEKDLQATEMKGFIKVGENTFPNLIPMLTGYSEEDLTKICYFTRYTKQDGCPFIWKLLDEANYLTAHSEDSPNVAIFNFQKAGFQHQPTDFYLRPLMLAGLDYASPPFYFVQGFDSECMGYQTNDELILNYVESLLELGRRNNTPVFSLSWSTTWSHEDLNMIQLSDAAYSSFLQRMFENGYLENTILIFMGDHGYRYGDFRQTLPGFYEDKLPNLWIRLPNWVQEEFPDWQSSMEVNSRRPTSFYTLYWTLNLILETFSSLDPPKDSVNSKTLQNIPRKFGDQSFFTAVPEENSCDSIGVPDQYCPCSFPQEVKLEDALLKRAAIEALAGINDRISKEPFCATQRLKKIVGGALAAKKNTNMSKIILSFVTTPGEFAFEAEVTYSHGDDKFHEMTKLQRINSISQKVIECIKHPVLEQFCYCQTDSKSNNLV